MDRFYQIVTIQIVSSSKTHYTDIQILYCKYLNYNTKCIVLCGKTGQSGDNKQIRNNANIICKYYLTQVCGEEVGAGRLCVWEGRGRGGSLSWVMAESSRW